VGGPAGSQPVSPATTTTYTLQVILHNGQHVFREATIIVEPTPIPVDATPPTVLRAISKEATIYSSGESGCPLETDITALVTDDKGVARVIVRYRLARSSTWQTLPMSRVSGDTYQAVLKAPQVSDDETLYWFVRAQDAAGNVGDSNTNTIRVGWVCIS
jgi:hypothetical protein